MTNRRRSFELNFDIYGGVRQIDPLLQSPYIRNVKINILSLINLPFSDRPCDENCHLLQQIPADKCVPFALNLSEKGIQQNKKNTNQNKTVQ